jgi:hypothetical protein
MRPVSDLWVDAIRVSHRIAVRATILDEETEIALEEVLSGQVTLDARAATRGRCDLTVSGASDLVPTSRTDALAPYGNEIRIERGITYPGGSTELVSLGVFRIEDATIADSGDNLEVRISGLDRSARLIDARFEEPYQVASGTNIADAILEVVTEGWPEVATDFMVVDATVPKLIAEEGGDRWAFAQSMATSIGAELYFDGDGVLILRPVPTPTQDFAYELVEGEDGVLVSAERTWSRQGAFNRVIATGENTKGDTSVRGVATDEDPDSPTYYYGQFGQVPRFYSSPFITTDEQAEDAAAGILAKELGATQSVSFGAIVDPALEPGDVVKITRQRAGIDETNVIDALTIPLSAEGTLTGTTRATQA